MQLWFHLWTAGTGKPSVSKPQQLVGGRGGLLLSSVMITQRRQQQPPRWMVCFLSRHISALEEDTSSRCLIVRQRRRMTGGEIGLKGCAVEAQLFNCSKSRYCDILTSARKWKLDMADFFSFTFFFFKHLADLLCRCEVQLPLSWTGSWNKRLN